jgi:hypothetical protein
VGCPHKSLSNAKLVVLLCNEACCNINNNKTHTHTHTDMTDMIQNKVHTNFFVCRTLITNFTETHEVVTVMKYADSYNVRRYSSPYAMPEDPSDSDLGTPTMKRDMRFCSQTYL